MSNETPPPPPPIWPFPTWMGKLLKKSEPPKQEKKSKKAKAVDALEGIPKALL